MSGPGAPGPGSGPAAPADTPAPGSAGYCPVCGAGMRWIPTAHLWPSRKSAQAVLPSQSGICADCGRSLMFTVVHEPARDAGGETT